MIAVVAASETVVSLNLVYVIDCNCFAQGVVGLSDIFADIS